MGPRDGEPMPGAALLERFDYSGPGCLRRPPAECAFGGPDPRRSRRSGSPLPLTGSADLRYSGTGELGWGFIGSWSTQLNLIKSG